MKKTSDKKAVAYIRKNYGKIADKHIMDALHIGRNRFNSLISKHGISKYVSGETMKCEACLQVFRIEEFRKSARSKSGFIARCKCCIANKVMLPPKSKISAEQIKWVIANYATTPNKDVLSVLGINDSYRRKLVERHGLKKSPEFIKKLQLEGNQKANVIVFTIEQEQLFIDEFPITPTKILADKFKVSTSYLTKKARTLGLKKKPNINRIKVQKKVNTEQKKDIPFVIYGQKHRNNMSKLLDEYNRLALELTQINSTSKRWTDLYKRVREIEFCALR